MSSALEKLRARLAASTQTPAQVPAQVPVPVPEPEPEPYVSVVNTEGVEGSVLEFKNKLLELEQKLSERVDNFPYLLRDIHHQLSRESSL